MRVLVVGGGAREHALCWGLARDPSVDRVLCAPGNPGIAEVAERVDVAATDAGALADLAERERVDLVVVGPEMPLVAGMVDLLERRGVAAFGPPAAGARIEGSKAWAKSLCERHGIPAARSAAFDDAGRAFEHLESLPGPYVVKVDGLAAGKGVTVTGSVVEARAAVRDALVRRAFGGSGATVLVEEHLEGEEVSALAITDGSRVLPLPLAQDFKRAGDGDTGPNTGGMGAYSPVPFVDAAQRASIVSGILERAVAAMADEGVPYRGVLYAGLMLTASGPRVLEFNCRFGDPETQVLIPRLRSPLGRVLLAAASGDLGDAEVAEAPEPCVGVVLASGGYPGEAETGFEVHGLAAAAAAPGIAVFHAGTAERQGRVVTAGGRVITVSALGSDLRDARERAYAAASEIRFEGKSWRTDIAARAAAWRPAPRAEEAHR
jgi:phosphoribosylamine--glycine ligase